MIDWIGGAASVVTVLGGGAAVAAWLKRRSQSATPVAERHPHQGLQVWPIHYLIQLGGDIPNVEIALLAINYLRKPLDLRELKIGRFNAGGLPALDNIPLLTEIALEPKSARVVHCSRRLVDM